jgi:hypothetical protein
MKAILLTLLLACSTATAMDYSAVFTAPPRHVPTTSMPDGPLLGNGDVGVVLAGPPERQQFYIGKNDFWSSTPGHAKVLTVGRVELAIPALQGATYRQEQDMGNAEVRGTFAKDGSTLRTRSWVDAHQNLLITELECDGGQPMAASLKQAAGSANYVPATVADKDRPAIIGRESDAGGRWYFNGSIADVDILPRALSAEEIHESAATQPSAGDAKVFDGVSVFQERKVSKMSRAVSVSAWIKIEAAAAKANYIVSKGTWNQAYSLGLSKGRLRWTIDGTFIQTQQALPLHQRIHVAATFDGQRMCMYVDGILKASLGDANGGTTDAKNLLSWFTRAADAAPPGREVAVVSRFVGATPQIADTGELTITLEPGKPVYLATAVLTDLDARDFLAAGKSLVGGLAQADIATLSSKHRGWWSDFWSRSFIEIRDKEIEKRWYAALYVMGSCSRPGKVAPGLWGNWSTTDNPNWQGDFHLNYNFQAPFYMVYSANHADLSLPFCQAIVESEPNGRAMAKRHGWKGIHLPVGIGPWGLSSYNPDLDLGQRSDAAFAALNFISYWQYTHDTEWLKSAGYPYLREVAEFWENYLKFENGRYVDYNDSIHELSGPDMNPLLSLALVRTLFKNIIPMSEMLGVDAEKRAKWQDIRDKISAFPLQERGGKTVFRYSEKGTDWWDGNTLGIHPIFPAGAIGLGSDPKLLEISRNTIDAMNRWADYNGFSSWYTACARVGYDPKIILARLRAECDKHSLPNLILYYGGGGIESCGGFLAINEMLMQSHEGIIRFFPDWPRDEDARFGNLRAVGAFLVSAEMKNGVVTGVKMVSEKGLDCTVQNPWPGKSVRLIRNAQPGELLSGDRFNFKTKAGEIFGLQPR